MVKLHNEETYDFVFLFVCSFVFYLKGCSEFGCTVQLSYNPVRLYSMWKDIILVRGWHCETLISRKLTHPKQISRDIIFLVVSCRCFDLLVSINDQSLLWRKTVIFT